MEKYTMVLDWKNQYCEKNLYLNFVLRYSSLTNPSGDMVIFLEKEIVLLIFVCPSPPSPITELNIIFFPIGGCG